MMIFSDEEISLAKTLRDLGLPWRPAIGQFVYDEAGLIEAPSPFQDRVFFILDLKHFLRRTGTVENLIRSMFWLPNWAEARQILRSLDVADSEVASKIQEELAIESWTELKTLYALIRNKLAK